MANAEQADPIAEHPERKPNWRKRAGVAVVAALFALIGLSVAGAGDVIDLPGWANVRGVDIPLIGDTDAIDCRLAQVDGTRRVEITIVDGDASTYLDYVHVWNNGNLVDPGELERVDDDTIISSSTPGTDEQWFSISDTPVRESRVFCEMVLLEG